MRTPDPRRIYLFNGFWRGASLGAFGLAAMVWWVVDLELSPLRLILLGTIMELVVLVSESPTGVVADVYSRKWSVVISWVIMGGAQILTARSGDLAVLLVWQALWGFGFTFQSGADTAWVSDEIGRDDDSLVLARAVASSLGVIVGVGGAMALSQWSLTGAIAVSGVMGVGFGLVLAVVMPERNFTPVDRSGRSSSAAMVDTWRRGLRLVWSRRVLRIVTIATFLVGMVDEIVDRLDLARMRELGFPDLDGAGSALWFGGVWVAMTVLTIPVMLAVGRRVESASDRRSAVIMTSFLAVGALGVGFMAGSIFALAVLGWVLRDVIREVVDPVGEAWVNRHASSDVRATVISFRNQSTAFGEIFGGLAIGAVAELVDLRTAFAIGAGLLATATLLIGRLLVEREPAAPPVRSG